MRDDQDVTRKHAMPGRGHPRSWVVVLGLVLLVAGALLWWTDTREAAPAARDQPRTGGSAAAPPTELPAAEVVRARPGAPRRVVIPALDVDSPVVPVRAPGGVLTPPADPQTLGWWADGARPGDRRGSALVTGHTVSTGGGALDDLEQLAPGDDVRVRSRRTTTVYDVRSVVTYERGELARRAEQLFDQSVRGRLVLITCEDWNGSEYLSNVVVTAVPVAGAA